MEIKYQKSLPHQQKAVDAIVNVFENVNIERPTHLYENPTLNLNDNQILENIRKIQSSSNCKDVPPHVSKSTNSHVSKYLTLDIKMETGTGKTYVYTQTIYELHKRFGINKFIVAVPTLAIKEGAKSFLGDPDVKRHFSNTCGYNAEIDLCVLTAKQVKKGKRYFPSEVREFASGSYQNRNKIYVLLVNMALLSDRNDGMLGREDYDQTIQGFYKPYNAIKSTKPFVIIDEPHRFSRDQKAYQVIENKIVPQCIIRFGATFPEITMGSGKNKTKKKDYANLLYNLTSCEAFNQNLIKGVAKEHLELTNHSNEKIKILSIDGKKSVKLEHITSNAKKTTYTLYKDDSLGCITEKMNGLSIIAIGKDFVEFSNGQTKRKGEEFEADIFATSYQEAMMKLALQRHFETERANFDRAQRIKTLALFFIDDIVSFRGDADGNNRWLRDSFDKLLKEQLDEELNKENSTEYQSFLQESLLNIEACSAGYFAQDNSDSDDEIAKEVDDILRNKKQLLSFKNEDGTWNTRRFLFSKWTLKEGWDNPNVFTIAKLRSSGSENSKIQEVGRGLRLPVDEHGNRISNEEFLLNYIVDFQEKDFADKLVNEINGDTSSNKPLSITDVDLNRVANSRNIKAIDLFIKLLQDGFVDQNKQIIANKITDFYNAYPEFNSGSIVSRTKVVDRNRKEKNTVSIRAAKYQELKELWQKINQKYIIFFNNELNQKIENDFHLQKGAFDYEYVNSNRSKVQINDNQASLVSEAGAQYLVPKKGIPYNDFLKRIQKGTSLPIKLIHNKIVEYFKNNPPYKEKLINESSITRFISQFNDWKSVNVLGLLNYQKADYNTQETALTDINGNVKKEVTQGLIGTEILNSTPHKNYLYDRIAFDSELEKKNILSTVNDVIVFGKIPRRSIAIPTVLGNYSPDFMYVVKRNDGSQELNVVIETKGVDSTGQLRGEEKLRIECARKFFEQLQIDGYSVHFREQINNQGITNILQGLVDS